MDEVRCRVKARFAAEGVSISEWARARGFNVVTVYRVLSGRSKALRGESHHIAVALGIKPTPADPMFSRQVDAA